MKRLAGLVSLAMLLSFTLATDARAQATLFLGGGGTFPTGQFDDIAKTGWTVGGGIGFPVGDEGLMVGVEGFYGSNSHDVDDDKTNVTGVLGLIGYSFADEGGSGLYVLGGAGWVANQLEPADGDKVSTNQFGLTAGVGYTFPLSGSISGFIEARVTDSDEDDTGFGGISAGIGIPLGGG